MMTNISVAKSSLLPSKITHDMDRLRLVWALLHEEAQRRESVRAVDDQVLTARLLEISDVRERRKSPGAARSVPDHRRPAPTRGAALLHAAAPRRGEDDPCRA